MRILIVSPELPYPPSWGFSIRVSQVLSLLARHHYVTLLTYAKPGDDAKVAALAQTCAAVHTVHAGDAPSIRKRLLQLTSLLSRRSFQGRYLYSNAMQQKLNDLCARAAFDIIQVETSQMMTFSFDQRSAVVVDEHDVAYELLARIAMTERSFLRRVYNSAEARKYKREEIDRWSKAAACVVTSTREVPILRGNGVTSPILTAPNGVDVKYFAPSGAAHDPDTLVMTGLMRTRPNIDAATFFVRDILPKILVRRPNARIYIVGGDPAGEVKRLASANVVVTGGVPDVRPYVSNAAVVVVPLRMGGGTRLKVLEGLSMRKPIVSTSLGCEGIEVKHEEHLLIADDPAGFAEAVLRIMDEPLLGRALAENGYALVHGRYQWTFIVQQLEAFYEELLRTPGRRADAGLFSAHRGRILA
jgi:sugar transferase (PEP-CTERM/EpsH1 system associated)